MYLTNEEERIYDGEYGESKAIAIRLLVSIGEINGATSLIPIKSAHISGVSYKNIGDGGLRFLSKIRSDVSVPTTVNPLGFDLNANGPVSVNDNFRNKQMEIIKLFISMGVKESFTCTPYYFYLEPKYGDHLAWAESSALIYANSIIGARTNREGGPSALAAAIIGKTPNYGLHMDENRYADYEVYINSQLDYSGMAALGLYLGNNFPGKIPRLIGFKYVKDFELKAFGAALAASSSTSMFHVEGRTPDDYLNFEKKLEKVSVDYTTIEQIIYSKSTDKKPELIAIGCPHLSKEEFEYIANMVRGKKKDKDIEVFLFASRETIKNSKDYVKVIEEFGAKVFADTCMVVSPLSEKYKITGVNSGKASFYLPMKEYGGQDINFRSINELMRWAIIDN